MTEDKKDQPTEEATTTQKDFWKNLLLFLMPAWLILFISKPNPTFLILIGVTLLVYAIRYWYRSVPATLILVRSGMGGQKVGRAMFVLPYFHKIIEIPTKKFEVIIEFGEKSTSKTKEYDEEKNQDCDLPPYQAKDTLVSGRVQAYVGIDSKQKTAVIKTAEGLGELLQESDDKVDRFFKEMLQSAVKSAMDESLLEEIHQPLLIQDRIKGYMVKSCERIGFIVDSINPVRLQQTRLDLLPAPLETGEHQDVYVAKTYQKVAEISSIADQQRFEAIREAKKKEAATKQDIAIQQSMQFLAEQSTAKEKAGIDVATQIESARGNAEQIIQIARGNAESSKLNQEMEAQMESFRRTTLAASEEAVMRHVADAVDFLKKSGVVSVEKVDEIAKARITWEYVKMFPDGATRDAMLQAMGMDVEKIRAIAKPLENANINIIGGTDIAEMVAKIPALAQGANVAIGQIPILQKLISGVSDMIDEREKGNKDKK